MQLTIQRNNNFLLLFLIFFITACTNVRLVSNYDEQTDKALMLLQQNTDDFITKLIANAPSENNSFEKNKNFYEDADQQIRRLEFRVSSIPKNDTTQRLVKNIRTSILGDGKCDENGSSLKDLHCSPENIIKGPSKMALQISQRNINQSIGAALSLELAKKQGLDQN